MIFNLSKYNNHWSTKKLSELGDFKRGKSKHRPRNDKRLFENGIYPLIQTGDVKESNIFIGEYSKQYNDFGLKQSKIWPKGTLCITVAANIAETAILSYDMCFPDSVVGFSANNDECTEIFMHYIFSYIRKTIKSRIQGSIQDNINLEYLTGISFKIPEKQKLLKIEKILLDLDLKIELNNNINVQIKSLVKLIYDYWFVQFDFPNKNGEPYKSSGGKMIYEKELNREIPKDWVKCKLGDVIKKIGTGLNPRNNFKLGGGNNYYITIKNIEQGKVILDDNCDRIDDSALEIINKRSDLNKGDILYTSIQPVGTTYFVQEAPCNWNINESVFTIRPDCEKVSSEFLYCFLSGDYIKAYTDNASAGSVHKGIRHESLKDCKFILPPKDIIKKFTKNVTELLSKQYLIEKENRELIRLRDWLLPMLMNGQVTVK
tara:strand:- start:386 stop:1678 length:1293 start_codon:yes stop_codon:yes gene_type:complete